MALRRAGVDRVVLALWLGHEKVETTDIYVHADLGIKERALARTRPPDRGHRGSHVLRHKHKRDV
jgi:site-specific recombinase XerD